MTTAQVALVVAIFGTLVATASLGWNIIAFVRSGARVKVTLSMYSFEVGSHAGVPFRSMETVSIKDWVSDNDWRRRPYQHFLVAATNTGRSATWVNAVGLSCRKSFISACFVVKGDGSAQGEELERDSRAYFGPVLPYKLDPGDPVKWAIAVPTAAVFWELGEARNNDRIRGQIELGNGGLRRSRRGAAVHLVREAASCFTRSGDPDRMVRGRYSVEITAQLTQPPIDGPAVRADAAATDAEGAALGLADAAAGDDQEGAGQQRPPGGVGGDMANEVVADDED
jgi:hypothetical protein